MKSKASRTAKRKADPAPSVERKLRSKLPRRRREQITPVVRFSPRCKDGGVSVLSVGSSSRFFLDDDVSCGSSRVSERANSKKRTVREFQEHEGRMAVKDRIVVDLQFKRITRSYYRQLQESAGNGTEVEVTGSSVVESNSGKDSALKSLKSGRGSRTVKGGERVTNDAVSVSESEITCVEQACDARNLQFLLENMEADVVSFTSGVEFGAGSYFGAITRGSNNKAEFEIEVSEGSKPYDSAEEKFAVLNAEAVVEQKWKLEEDGSISDLACREQFSYDNASVYSDDAISSEPLSDIYLSDYTPSIFFDSGSEFSQKSQDDSPSETYCLFLKYKEQFSRSSIPIGIKSSNREEQYNDQSALVRFETHEEEDSYQKLRERERRGVFLGDYTEYYCSRTGYGDLVLCQRSILIQWIVEECMHRELQQETLFLGVTILDRFLSRGYFKSERILQIVGIASLTLAIRIEENQPRNSINQETFYIQRNKYRRCEVVAMEWLVQEILNFKCFLPTIYNFLCFYLKGVRAGAKLEERAKYLSVLALSDNGQLCYWPSTVAAGLVILASMENNQPEAYQRVIQIHLRTKDDDLSECVKSLEWLLEE